MNNKGLPVQEGEDKSLKSPIAVTEEQILEFWNKNEIFKKTLEKESPNGNFVFYDGPPFATGLPHYGHILPGTIKDIIPRYQTMKGKRVLRRWGWDCHGLPIENLIEKELGLKSKKDIDDYGVEKFNFAARNKVFQYAEEWKKIIPRSGRWIDMDNDYRTMDSSYTESVWWSFKTLYDKGLIYQGYKVMLFCPHCETTLSNFEVNQGYKDITDISVYVKFELMDEPNTFILAWTTTPWTLPGNVALAVNKDIEYVKVRYPLGSKIKAMDFPIDQNEVPHAKNNYFIVAKELKDIVIESGYEIEEEILGEKLLGKKYKPVFDYYADSELDNKENGWKIYHGDFVTTESGTGVVHIAPAFGEDDYNLAQKEKLPFIQHVNRNGTFKTEVKDFAGQLVKPKSDDERERLETDINIIRYLQEHGTYFDKQKIVHSYPHCWRCNTPLLNYATTSWFVKVTDMKDKLVSINKDVSWTPEEIGEGRFGKWLEGARDWAISRSRYWGAPLPVWEGNSGERVIFGSIDELKKNIKSSGNKYYVMRHGETISNVKKVWNVDPTKVLPLTDQGKNDVSQSARTLKDKKIDIIFVSPYGRTQDTAKIIVDELGLSKDCIVIDPRIGEWNVGKKWEEKSVEEFFSDKDYQKDKYGYKTEEGEAYKDVLVRCGEFLFDIETKYSGKNILIISHGASARAILLVTPGYSLKTLAKKTEEFIVLKNGEIREFDFVPLPHNEMYELDLHKPYIDEITVLKDGKELKRVPEIFDTWYDSGSMPFAQQHYPFENKDLFEQKNSPLFPADFISEGLDQTRGWFYTLLVMSVGLFEKSSYKHVLVNGLVLAEDGRKMSKSLNNYPDPIEIINKYGADSLRFYLMASPLVKAEEFNFSEKAVDEVYKKLIQKLYNVLSFYEMYPVDKNGELKDNILDKWIISRLNELNKNISINLDKYELDKATRPIMDFVDDLSTWYLRRSRDRFKSEDIDVRYSASYYMRFVLLELSKLIAPFIPFIAEEVYRRVGGQMESVHLENWPEEGGVNEKLLNEMEIVRNIVSSALEKRQESGYKVRQPLASVFGVPEEFSDGEFSEIIKDEINVKKISPSPSPSPSPSLSELQITLDTNLTEELKNEGIARDIVRAIQDARKTENLNPSQKIKLTVHAGEKVKEVIESFQEMIKFPTQVTEITFSNEKQTHQVDLEEKNTSISIAK